MRVTRHEARIHGDDEQQAPAAGQDELGLHALVGAPGSSPHLRPAPGITVRPLLQV